MRRFLILVACLTGLLHLPALAQEDDDEPVPPPRRHGQTKIGGAAGFTQDLLFIDLDPINQVLRNSNAAPFDKQPLVLLGGQGYGYILLLPNVRVGGIGGSGTMRSKSLQGLTRRDVELSVGFGGVTIDYVVPVIPRVDVALGGVFGGGGMSLKLTRDDGYPKSWADEWNQLNTGSPPGPNFNYSTTLSGSFFVYQPRVAVEVAILRWLGVRVGASYNGMAGNSWKVDDNYDLVGVPDNVSGKGWMIDGGLFIGTFVF